MNKIYHTVWNETTGTWVAVQETARAKGKKSNSAKASVGMALALASLAGFSGVASATINTTTAGAGGALNCSAADAATASGTVSFALGCRATATADYATAIGVDSKASGDQALAVGNLSSATAQRATAIGTGASASDLYATALGSTAKASGDSAIAIGRSSTAVQAGDIAIGKNASSRAVLSNAAVGLDLRTNATSTAYPVGSILSSVAVGSGAVAQFGTAIGADAQAGKNHGAAGYSSGTAIGAAANATGSNSIAISSSHTNPAVATGSGSIAMGTAAWATNTSSVAIGSVATSTADRATAIGRYAEASGYSSLALSSDAKASGENAVAIGTLAVANISDSIAIGSSATTSGSTAKGVAIGYKAKSVEGAIAIGESAYAESTLVSGVAQISVAVGMESIAKGQDAAAFGTKANAQSDFGTAVGNYANTSARNATAVGNAASASGVSSSAFGNFSNATGSNATAIGGGGLPGTFQGAQALADGATAVGGNDVKGATASGKNATAISGQSQATAENAIAIGLGAQATAKDAISIGTGNIVTGKGSGAIGDPTTVNGAGTYVYGNNNGTIDANNSGVFGNDNTLTGALESVRVVGNKNTVSADYTSVMGNSSTVSGRSAISIGNQNVVSGQSAVAIGEIADATGLQSFAAGYDSSASGKDALALGTATQASGVSSTAVGRAAWALANYATSVGAESTVDAAYASALGAFATATKENSVALGSNAKTDTNATKEASATLNNLTYGKFAGQVTDPGMQVSVGSKGAERQIKNVGSGAISATSTDAINGSQLHATNEVLGNVANTTKNILGGNAALNTTGGLTMTNIGGTGKNTIHDAIAASQEEVVAGTNIASVVKTTDATTGVDTFTVNAKGTTASAGSTAVTVTSKAGANNVTDYVVDLSKATQDKIDGALQTVVTQIDGTTVKTINKTDNTANFLTGNNIKLSADSLGGIEVATADNVTFTDVITTNLTVTGETQLEGDTYLSGDTYYTGPITNGNNIVNKTYVDNSITTLANNPLNFAGDTGSAIAKKLGETLTISGKLAAAADATGANLRVDSADGKLNLVMAKDLTDLNSITINGGPTINGSGINMGGDKITNLAAGEVSATSTDAVNGSQLYAVSEVANAGWNIATDSGTASNVKPGDTVNMKGDGSVVVSNTGNDVTVGLADSITVGTANTVTIDGNTGVIGGLTNKTWDPANIVSGQAATEDQLKLASTALTDTGINITAQGGSPDNVKLGETIDYANADGNIVVTATKDNQILFDLASKVTVGTTNPVVVDGNTGTLTVGSVTNPITLSSTTGTVNGLDNITWNPAAITSGQAATEDQLKQAAAAAKTTVTQGDNIVVTPTKNPDGSITYQVATAKDVVFDSVTVGSVSLDSKNVDAAGNTIISGVGAGEVSSTSTDAINGSQLYALGTGVQNIIGGTTTYDPTTGTYVNNNIGNTGQSTIHDAIASVNDAATKAKTTVTQGDNIVVTQTTNADGSTNYKVATAKDVAFDSVTVGSVSIDSTNVDAAGNTIISGVGAGAVSATSTDAINGSQLYSLGTGVQNIIGGSTTYDPTTGTYVNNNIGNTGQNNINDAIASVNDAATKAKTTVTAGSNVVVTPTTNADGSSNYEVAVANDLNVNSVTSNAVTVGSVSIDKSNVDAAGNTIISGVGAGAVSATSTDAINGSQLYATNQQVAQNTTDITNINTTLDKGMNFSADSGTVVNRKLGDTVAITGDGNITTTTTADGVQVGLSNNLNLNNVTVNQSFSVAEGATVNMGGNVIQNVAPGVNGTDAVNVNQVNAVAGNLNNRISNVGHIANAGVAQAIATAGLPQAYAPGKSMMAIAGGTYEGEAGYAIGFSTISDNGKWVIKATGSGNSRGKYGASIGAGYQW